MRGMVVGEGGRSTGVLLYNENKSAIYKKMENKSRDKHSTNTILNIRSITGNGDSKDKTINSVHTTFKAEHVFIFHTCASFIFLEYKIFPSIMYHRPIRFSRMRHTSQPPQKRDLTEIV